MSRVPAARRRPRGTRLAGAVAVAVAAVALASTTGGLRPDDPAGAAARRPPSQIGIGTTVVPAETTSTSATGPTSSTAAASAVVVPARAPAPDVARAGVALVDQTDWLAEGEPFDLRVALGDDVDDDASIVVDLHAAVTSRSQFTATLDGQVLGARRAEVVIPLRELSEQPDGSRRIRLTPAATDVAGERSLRGLTRPGVYPLVVGVRPADADDEPPAPLTTYIVRTPTEGTTPLRVAVVQPVQASLAHQPDGSVAVDGEALVALAALAEVLASSAGTPLTVLPRPETVEALARMAEEASGPDAERATAVLDDLTAAAADADSQIVSEPYVDISLDALEAAGLGDDVAVQRRRGDAAVRAALGVRTDVRTWVADDGVNGASLRRLAGLGVDQVLLPDEALSPVELRLSLSRRFAVTVGDDGSELAAAAPEPALSVRYGADDPILGAQHVLADLAVLQGDEPGPLRPRGVILAPPSDVAADPVFLTAVLAGLATSPILEPVTLNGYFSDVDLQEVAGEPLVREVTPGGGGLGISAAEVATARSRLTGFASMVTGEVDKIRLLGDLVLLAEADGLDIAERRAYLAAIGAGINTRIGSVGVVDAGSFRLADSEGTIPLTLARDGNDPLKVRVTLESERLAFGPDRQVGRLSYDVELTSENTPLVVPVVVRSPGTFPLLVTITSPDGRLEVTRTQVTIRSTAFSGVGVGLSVGAGFFLALWWGRHWRTVRRAKRLVPVA